MRVVQDGEAAVKCAIRVSDKFKVGASGIAAGSTDGLNQGC